MCRQSNYILRSKWSKFYSYWIYNRYNYRAIVLGEYAYNTTKENGANGWELFGWTMLGIIGGGLIGGAIGATLGYFAGMSFRLQYLRDLLF